MFECLITQAYFRALKFQICSQLAFAECEGVFGETEFTKEEFSRSLESAVREVDTYVKIYGDLLLANSKMTSDP